MNAGVNAYGHKVALGTLGKITWNSVLHVLIMKSPFCLAEHSVMFRSQFGRRL